jgi:hypothetical protein
LNSVILKALSYEPEKRYPNAQAFIEALKGIKGSQHPTLR